PFPGEPAADLRRLSRDRGRVFRVGGKAAAHVALPRGPSQDLIVRRKELDVSERGHAQLDARAAQVRADDPLLDDAAALPEARGIGLVAQARKLETHPAQALADAFALARGSGLRQSFE